MTVNSAPIGNPVTLILRAAPEQNPDVMEAAVTLARVRAHESFARMGTEAAAS